MESTFPQIASTLLINFSLAWIVGILAAMLWLRRATLGWQVKTLKRLWPVMTVALIGAAVGILLSLWTESAAMGDVPWLAAWPACKEMLTSTHYGHAGVAAIGLLIAALAVHWRLEANLGKTRYLVSMTALVLLVAIARVMIGHAFEHGLWSAAVWLEWIHLLLMSLWTGIVFVAGWMVLPRVLASESTSTKQRAAYMTTMSDWATVALAGILITGTYNAYRVLNGLDDLVEADYGHVLLFKFACVLVAIALGAYNKFFGLPNALFRNLEAAKSRSRLAIVIAVLRIESVALLLVLAAAAVMTNSAPPGQ